MKKTAVILILIIFLSKAIGFSRDVILAYYYGASSISDAYLISLTIPVVVFSFIQVALSTAYIPLYNEIKIKNSEKRANQYTNNILSINLVLCTIIILITLIGIKPIVHIFAAGFDEKTFNLAVEYTRISIFSIYFISCIAVFIPFLHVNNKYYIPALIGFPLNIITIISIVVSTKLNSKILAYGSVLAYFSQFILLYIYIYIKGFRYKFFINIKDIYIKKLLIITIPAILGASVNQINVLIDRTIASGLPSGSISVINYANQLTLLVESIFVAPFITIMYPVITKMIVNKDIDNTKKTIKESVNSVSLLVTPAMIGFLIFSREIVILLYGRGAFEQQAIQNTSNVLFYLSLGLIGFGFREVLVRVFYAMQDTKTPVINSVIAMIMNIILNIILSEIYGVVGLALATSISAIFAVILLFISLQRKTGLVEFKNISITFVKILIASLAMGVISRFIYNNLLQVMSNNLTLIISIISGALIYLIIISFMKIEDVDKITNIIVVKFRKLIRA